MKPSRLVAVFLAGTMIMVAGCEDDAGSSEIPGTLQAENADSATGGRSIPRSNAEGSTVWHLDRGEEMVFTITGGDAGRYSVRTRHSNDDTGRGDTVGVLVDGIRVGSFRTGNTGGGGDGWNAFTTSPQISLGTLDGNHSVVIRLEASDGYGVDIDSLRFTKTAEQ